MTADVPRQRTRRDKHIATICALVHAGVVGQHHGEHPNPRWPELCRAADALGLRPEDAVYLAHTGNWPNPDRHTQKATTP